MAYKTEELYKEALEAAKKENIFFIEDIISLISCSKPTFYEHFPIDSNELNNIKKILERKKIDKKAHLRDILSRSDKAAEILALYKLIGTEEERKKLSQGYIDLTSDGDRIGKDGISLNVNFQNFAEDE